METYFQIHQISEKNYETIPTMVISDHCLGASVMSNIVF